jgi:hypothetical protein
LWQKYDPTAAKALALYFKKINAISRFASAPTLKTLGKNEANSK